MTEPVVVGRYLLGDVIGDGGMAQVHLGRIIGAAGFSRVVAIKRLHPAAATDPEFTTMLADEARLASRIRHPNVIPTLDVVGSGPELLLVMEYVHGVSVAQLGSGAFKREERVPIPIVVRIVLDILAGLGAAHDAKSERGNPLEMVHRDVSPQNILVGSDGIARLGDFGIAKAQGKLSMTRQGQIKGKLAYMAPEQLRAEGTVDRRADLFATGIVMWELFVGARLFEWEGENLQAAIHAILAAKVAPPSSRVPFPAALDAVVLKALASDPDARFSTADEMAAALEAACRPAHPKEVAAYLTAIAGADLEARSAMVARAEDMSAFYDVEAPPREQPSAPPVVVAPERRRRIAPALVIAFLLVGAIGIALAVRAKTAPPLAGATAPAPSTKVEPAPSAEPAFEADDEPAPATSASTPHARVARPRPRAPKAPDCDPPYSIDGRGIRIPRRECLQP